MDELETIGSIPQPDRRELPRVGAHFMVSFRIPPQMTWQMSTLTDLSRAGARFVAEESPPPGVALDLRLRLPNVTEPVQTTGRVIWQRPAFSGRIRATELGLMFVALSVDVGQAIDDVIQRVE